jgi:uncharacterized RDD family membrane protein YckC
LGEFWVIRDGERIGPFAEDEILRSYESGALQGSDLLWAEGMTNSVTVEEAFAQLREDILTSSQPLALEEITPPADAAASPYAPPTAHVADVAESLTGPTVYAGFWVRYVAVVLDTLLAGLAGAVIGFVVGFVGALLGLGEDGTTWLGGVAGAVIGWLYFAVTESSQHRASPGKRALRLQVLTADGERRISFLRATGRWAARYLSLLPFLIGYLMQPFTARKQALHDLLAGTVVVAVGPTRRWLVALVLTLIVGLPVVGLVLGAVLKAIELLAR